MSKTNTPNSEWEMPDVGSQDNQWGADLIAIWLLQDKQIAGVLSKSVAGASDVTLTSSECYNIIHNYTGTLTGNINVVVVTKKRRYIVYNNTSGAFTLTVKTSAGTGVEIPQGGRALIHCDGTNVVRSVDLTGLGVSAVAATVLDDATLGEMAGTLFAKGSDVASAGTMVVPTDGGYFDVTGTTTITGMTVAAGRPFILQFDDAVTLTDGASLNLGAGNITTAAGDKGLFYATAADTVELIAWLDVSKNPANALHSDANETVSGDFTFTGEINADGPLAMGDGSELTISSGSVTPTANYHTIDTESDAASDALTDIDDTNMQDGAIVLIRANNTARTVVVTNGSGTHKIHTADGNDLDLDDDEKSIVLQLRGDEWYEVARSAAAATGGWELVEVKTDPGTNGITLGEGNIEAGYDYRIIVSQMKWSADTGTRHPVLQYGTGGGPTYQTSGYVTQMGEDQNATHTTERSTITTGVYTTVNGFGGASAGEYFNCDITIDNPGANAIHAAFGSAWGHETTGVPKFATFAGWRTTSEVVTGFRIMPSSTQTADTGTAMLLRRKRSL